MITVAGFNTAIDRFVRVGELQPGEIHRAIDEQVYPGGKGLHVAQTIAALGERVQLVGIIDAAHRNLVGRHLNHRGVLFHGIEIDGSIRTCIALQEPSGRVTEVLGQGPQLGSAHREALLSAVQRCIEDSELLILSGSLPRGLSTETYAELAVQARAAGKRCLVDASGAALRLALQARPTLVKPNREEAGELLGRAVDDVDAAIAAVRELRASGIATPVVSLGALGAVAADADAIWHATIEPVPTRNTVGSGDCLLAGMAVGMVRGMDLQQTLRWGVACGAANAQGEETGFVERQAVEALFSRVRVQRLD